MCTYFAEIDLKGSVPSWIIKQAFKDQGNQIVKLRKCVPAYVRENSHLLDGDYS